MNAIAQPQTPRAGAVSEPSEREVRATCVHGDSTPFPYEGNFIETIRHAVDCGVALMTAQHAIVRAGARANEVERMRQAERARLDGMAVTVRRSVVADGGATERVQRTAARIVEATRIAVESELAQLEAAASEQLAKARAAKQEARASALRAVETFLLHHDLPDSQIGLRLTAQDGNYASYAHLSTPFGVDAVFELLVPTAHEWGRVRRVGDLTTGVEVHVPLEAGLFFKRVEVQPVKLDRLFLSAIHLSPERSTVVMRKGPRSGSGYKLEFDTSRGLRVVLWRLDEEGNEVPEQPIDLAGDDAVHVLRFWQRLRDATADLPSRRQVMTSAMVDARPIQDLDEPQLVCERLVGVLAPVVREIAKRSGAPGELVLRRNVGAGRRDEIYITKAELHEKVMTLPPALRLVFDPFELDSSPRSPRAPAPSLSAYEEVNEDEVLSVTAPRPSIRPSHRPTPVH